MQVEVVDGVGELSGSCGPNPMEMKPYTVYQQNHRRL
jgi:hypothetical protein